MKKVLSFTLVVILFTSCMAFHAGSTSGSAALSSANFDYVQKRKTQVCKIPNSKTLLIKDFVLSMVLDHVVFN